MYRKYPILPINPAIQTKKTNTIENETILPQFRHRHGINVVVVSKLDPIATARVTLLNNIRTGGKQGFWEKQWTVDRQSEDGDFVEE